MVLDARMLKELYYPFPTRHNPLMLELQAHTDATLYNGRGILAGIPSEAQELYKRVRTAHITSWWYPDATWEQLQPLELFMNWTMIMDDIHDMATYEEGVEFGRRVVAITRGEMTADEAAIVPGWITERTRQLLLEHMPAGSVDRFANSVEWFFEGMLEEVACKQLRRFPTERDYFIIRDRSICMYPFWDLVEVETGITIPLKYHYHPVVMRMKSLGCRMLYLLHDLQSIDKDEATGTPDAFFNYVRVLRHYRGMSREEATTEAIRVHNACVDEYVHLQEILPDFGKWREPVADLLRRMGVIVHGWKSVDPVCERYLPDGSGTIPAAVRRELVKRSCGQIPYKLPAA